MRWTLDDPHGHCCCCWLAILVVALRLPGYVLRGSMTNDVFERNELFRRLLALLDVGYVESRR